MDMDTEIEEVVCVSKVQELQVERGEEVKLFIVSAHGPR